MNPTRARAIAHTYESWKKHPQVTQAAQRVQQPQVTMYQRIGGGMEGQVFRVDRGGKLLVKRWKQASIDHPSQESNDAHVLLHRVVGVPTPSVLRVNPRLDIMQEVIGTDIESAFNRYFRARRISDPTFRPGVDHPIVLTPSSAESILRLEGAQALAVTQDGSPQNTIIRTRSDGEIEFVPIDRGPFPTTVDKDIRHQVTDYRLLDQAVAVLGEDHARRVLEDVRLRGVMAAETLDDIADPYRDVILSQADPDRFWSTPAFKPIVSAIRHTTRGTFPAIDRATIRALRQQARMTAHPEIRELVPQLQDHGWSWNGVPVLPPGYSIDPEPIGSGGEGAVYKIVTPTARRLALKHVQRLRVGEDGKEIIPAEMSNRQNTTNLVHAGMDLSTMPTVPAGEFLISPFLEGETADANNILRRQWNSLVKTGDRPTLRRAVGFGFADALTGYDDMFEENVILTPQGTRLIPQPIDRSSTLHLGNVYGDFPFTPDNTLKFDYAASKLGSEEVTRILRQGMSAAHGLPDRAPQTAGPHSEFLRRVVLNLPSSHLVRNLGDVFRRSEGDEAAVKFRDDIARHRDELFDFS